MKFYRNYENFSGDLIIVLASPPGISSSPCKDGNSDTQMLQATFEAIRGCTRDCFEGCTEKGEIKGRPELQNEPCPFTSMEEPILNAHNKAEFDPAHSGDSDTR